MLNRVYRAASLPLALLLLLAGGMWGQSYQGGIRGLVTDTAGAAVAGVKVTLIDEGTSQSLSTITNETGEYVFNKLNPATYTMVAENPGFKKYERKGIIIATQQFITADLKMEIGDVNTTINVTEEVPVIETANASTGQTIDRQKLTDLPNLGRNPFMLSRIAQNVTPLGNPGYNRMQDQSGSSQISIAGGPVRGNNYLVDGVPITDSVNRAVIIPTIESVEEVKIQANTYDAEMGRTGGGVFNTYMKSGTNSLHGSALGYIRETDWLANTYFGNAAGRNADGTMRQPRGDQPSRNFGGSLGGPIFIPKLYDGRNKTFFFLGHEAYRMKTSYGANFSVPTAAEISGNFSNSRYSNGTPVAIFDPATGRLDGSNWIRDPFPGAIIPTNRMNVVGANIARQYPTPNIAGSFFGAQNLATTASLQDRADQFTGKLDHQVTSKWRASASYLWYKSLEPGENNFATPSSPNQWTLGRKVNSTQINNLITIDPTLVLSVRYGFNRFPNENSVRSLGYDLAGLGFSSNYLRNVEQTMFPVVTMSSLQSLGTNNRNYNVFYSRNFLVGASKFIGRHSLKGGFDYRRISVAGISWGRSSGAFSFTDVYTRRNPAVAAGGANGGTDLASLLLGLPATRAIDYGSDLRNFVDYYAGYVHDDFRVSSKLTVNFGIRYEWETGIQAANNALVVGFDRNAIYPVTTGGPNVQGGLMYAGQNGYGTSTFDPVRYKVSPRIGAAYQLNSKTILRGGWGLFWAPVPFGLQAPLGYTQDNALDVSFDGGRTAAVTLDNPYPTGVTRPIGNSAGLTAGTGTSVSFLDQTARSPWVQQYSFDVQRQLPWGVGLAVGYVGSRSGNLQIGMGDININQLDPRYFSEGVTALNTRFTNPFFVAGGRGLVGQSTLQRQQLLRAFPQFSNVNAQLSSQNRAMYHSAVVKVQKRLSNGLSFVSTYTWSQNMDNSWGGAGNFFQATSGGIQNSLDIEREYGLSSFHTPHRWTNAFTYELPMGKGKMLFSQSKLLDYAVGGWSINAISVFQTGFPLAVTQTNLNSPYGFLAQRPNATGVSAKYSGSDPLMFLNESAFSLAPVLSFGNIARTIPVYGPGQKNWDISVFKNFEVVEKVKVQFRAEALNAFNTPIFRGPNTTYQGPGVNANFGRVTAQANFPRFIQMGLRVTF